MSAIILLLMRLPVFAGFNGRYSADIEVHNRWREIVDISIYTCYYTTQLPKNLISNMSTEMSLGIVKIPSCHIEPYLNFFIQSLDIFYYRWKPQASSFFFSKLLPMSVSTETVDLLKLRFLFIYFFLFVPGENVERPLSAFVFFTPHRLSSALCPDDESCDLQTHQKVAFDHLTVFFSCRSSFITLVRRIIFRRRCVIGHRSGERERTLYFNPEFNTSLQLLLHSATRQDVVCVHTVPSR